MSIMDVSGVKPHYVFPTEHLFERKDSTSQKLRVFCSVVPLVWKGIQSCLFSKWLLYTYICIYIHIHIHVVYFRKKKTFLFKENIVA